MLAQNILIVTIGYPRSGKSTWARATGFPIVCPDAIRLGLHGKAFIKEAEPFVWVTAKLMVKALFLAGHQTVVLDACNVDPKRRAEWSDTDLWQTHYKLVPQSVDVCKERAIACGQDYLVEVIDRMATEANFNDIPTDRIYCDEAPSLTRK